MRQVHTLFTRYTRFILLATTLLCVGNVYVGDFSNNRIRRVTVSTGIITTIAGTGTATGDGGVATSAGLYYPQGVALDTSGEPALNIFDISFVIIVFFFALYRQRVHR